MSTPFSLFNGVWRPIETVHKTPIYYKFKSFDEFHLQLLLDNIIYFQNPRKFNDIDDCQIVLPYHLLSFEEFKSVAQRHRLDPEAIGMTDAQFMEYVRSVYVYITTQGESYGRKIAEEQSEKFGIYCLSANWDNTTLWDRYADHGKGFCIGFHANKIFDYLSKSGLRAWGEIVNYSDEPLSIDLVSEEVNIRTWGKLFSTKSTFWQPENEFRLIRYGLEETERPVKLEDGIIASITLGPNSSKTETDLLQIVNDRVSRGLLTHPRLYIVRSTGGGLTREEIY